MEEELEIRRELDNEHDQFAGAVVKGELYCWGHVYGDFKNFVILSTIGPIASAVKSVKKESIPRKALKYCISTCSLESRLMFQT